MVYGRRVFNFPGSENGADTLDRTLIHIGGNGGFGESVNKLTHDNLGNSEIKIMPREPVGQPPCFCR